MLIFHTLLNRKYQVDDLCRTILCYITSLNITFLLCDHTNNEEID